MSLCSQGATSTTSVVDQDEFHLLCSVNAKQGLQIACCFCNIESSKMRQSSSGMKTLRSNSFFNTRQYRSLHSLDDEFVQPRRHAKSELQIARLFCKPITCVCVFMTLRCCVFLSVAKCVVNQMTSISMLSVSARDRVQFCAIWVVQRCSGFCFGICDPPISADQR